MQLQLRQRDQGLVLEHPRVDHDRLLPTVHVLVRRVRQVDRDERRSVVIEKRAAFFLQHLHQPGVA